MSKDIPNKKLIVSSGLHTFVNNFTRRLQNGTQAANSSDQVSIVTRKDTPGTSTGNFFVTKTAAPEPRQQNIVFRITTPPSQVISTKVPNSFVIHQGDKPIEKLLSHLVGNISGANVLDTSTSNFGTLLKLPDPDPVKIAFTTDNINFTKVVTPPPVAETTTSLISTDGLPGIIFTDLPAHVVVEVQFIEKDKVTTECLQSLEQQETRMRKETPRLFVKEKKQYDKLIDPDVIVLSDEESNESRNDATAAPSPAPSDQTSNDKSLPSDWILYETDTNTKSPPASQVNNCTLPTRYKIAPRTYTSMVQDMKDKLTNRESSVIVNTSGGNKQSYFLDPSESPPLSSTRSYPGKIQSAISIKNINPSPTAVDNAVSRANDVKKPTKKIVLFSEDGKMKSISVPHIVLTDAAVQTSLTSKNTPRQTQSIQAVAKTRHAGVTTDFSFFAGCRRCLQNGNALSETGTQCELDASARFDFTEATDEKEISPDDYKIYKSGKHECLICGEICRNYKSLSRHIKDHGEKSTLCLFCGKVFTSDNRLQKHEQKRHLVNNNCKPKKRTLHICPYRKCEQMYETLIDLYDHINIHTSEKPHKCSCGKSFPSFKQYQFHLLKYKCSKVGYEYPYSYLSNSKQEYTKNLCKFYTRHKVIVGKYRKRKFTLNKFQCKYCRKILKNHFALSLHMQKVHPSKVRYKINSKCISDVVV